MPNKSGRTFEQGKDKIEPNADERGLQASSDHQFRGLSSSHTLPLSSIHPAGKNLFSRKAQYIRKFRYLQGGVGWAIAAESMPAAAVHVGTVKMSWSILWQFQRDAAESRFAGLNLKLRRPRRALRSQYFAHLVL